MSLRVLLLLIFTIAVSAQQTSFLPADTCQDCHRLVPGVKTAAARLGAPTAHHSTWKTTIMAHAAKDPYWMAKVHAEKAAHPNAPVSLDAVCMRCHAPMQAKTAEIAGNPVDIAAIDPLGRDGVACLVCHQILPERLGSRSSFTGQPSFSKELVAFGPHSRPFMMPMIHHTGVAPVEGRHILESAHCGVCHTLITPTLDSTGKVVGEFLEQAPYLEWLASGLPKQASCQSCHVPQATAQEAEDNRFHIAHSPGGHVFPPTSPRKPFGVHSFAGGNAQMLEYLAGMDGAAEGLADSAARTRQNLRRAASLRLQPVREQDQLRVNVRIRNLTGHKLPTGFPSRRVWVHFTALDSAGNVLFESGAVDASGRDILSSDPRVNAGLQPHRNIITSPQQVALYETELADAQGNHTHSLLRALRFHKDNRLLPVGFNPKAGRLPEGIPPEWLAPVGVTNDPDFQPGGDIVVYRLPAAISAGVARVRARLLYQSIKPSQLSALRGKSEAADAIVGSVWSAVGVETIASAESEIAAPPAPGL